MKVNVLSIAVATALLGTSVAADALELFVDTKTGQVYTTPGKGRARLGEFVQVDEKQAKTPAPETQSAKTEIQEVESRLNKKIETLAKKPKEPTEAKVKIDGRGLQMQTNDGAFKFAINGRIHADAAIHSEDKFVIRDENGANPTPIDLSDGTEIRRGRLEARGQFFDYWNFKSQFDFADEKVATKDLFIQYTGVNGLAITIGQSKQPFSYQQMMSSNDMPFIERSLEYAWTDASVNRAIGARFDVFGSQFDLPFKKWLVQFGAFGEPISKIGFTDSAGKVVDNDEGWGAAGRVVVTPWFKPGELVHVGVSGAYRTPGDRDHNAIRYRVRPTHIDHTYLIDTGNMTDVDDMTFANAEFTGIYGPFSVEAEYNRAFVNRNAAAGKGDDADFDGWHADFIYSLTGESRSAAYDPKEGVIKRLVPAKRFDLAGNWGAWELKGRISQVNLNNTGVPGIHGGRETAATVGLNWYLNDWFRLMADYTTVVDITRTDKNGNSRFLGGANPSDLNYMQLRGSLAF